MRSAPIPGPPPPGIRIAGSGAATPEKVVTNADLERLMDTSDDWIVQRTGIRQRHICQPEKGESVVPLAKTALARALESARIDPGDLDLIILATMTMESRCPPSACRLAHEIGAPNIGAFDLSGACCGYVFALNTAFGLMNSGLYNTVAVVGADTLSQHMTYDNIGRSTAILFGDGAGALVFRATDDPGPGLIAQAMHSDGSRWGELYIPESIQGFPEGQEPKAEALGRVQMNGRAVFKFAVSTFQEVIAQTLDAAGLEPGDVDHYVCHQSNKRILDAARDRFGLPEDRMHVNIDRYGNTVAASIPLCFDELNSAGRIQPGQRVMFVAFGGGLTWATSLWQL